MNPSRKLLLVGGLFLTLWGMGYGLIYALFDEHQTLDRMGERLVSGFAHAAERQMSQAQTALNDYAQAKFEYVREVDVHSHWTGLAMLLILLGLLFDQVGFEESKRLGLAVLLVAGSALFPLGVILQTVNEGSGPKALATGAAAMVIAGLAGVALGFFRRG